MCPERPLPGCGLSEPLLFGAFFLVPLAAAPWFVEPHTSAKWHLLAALAAGWLLVERFPCGSRGLPAVVARTWPAWAALAVSVVVGSLRHGLGWAVQPLTARAAFVALALAAFWCFRRTGLRLTALRTGALAAASIVIVIGLAQFAGFDPLSRLPGGDHRSATFGNVNMAAQFVGLALVVLLAKGNSASREWRRSGGAALEVLAAAAVAYLWLAGTRSVGLALVAAVVVLRLAGRVSVARLLRIGAGAAVLAGLILTAAPDSDRPLQASVRESKRQSALWRLAVWQDALSLIRDHPEGVGAGNFEQAFIPYALAGRSRPGETTVFRSPHNDYLRLASEEGVAGALLLLALLFVLARELHRSAAIARWRSEPGALIASCGTFLAVECFFQFPFEMAFPCLLAAVLLGLALACVDAPRDVPVAAVPPPRPGLRIAGDAGCVLLALGIGVGLVRTAAAEWIYGTSRGDAVALEQAWALDPRRLDACVEAAWLRGRAGDHVALDEGVRRVLERSPYDLPALKLLGEDLLARGQTAAGCRRLRAYDVMLGGRSSVSRRVREACGPAGTREE